MPLNVRLPFSARNFSVITPIAALFTFVILLSPGGHLSSRSRQSAPYPVWNSTSQTRSAWFRDSGYLRFDTAEGWGTVYETRAAGSEGYSCDAEKIMKSGTRLCVNTIRLWRALLDNSVAQQRILEAGEGAEPKARREDEELLRETYGELGAVRGKRILYLGDSTDRNSIDEMARALPTCDWHMYEPVSGKEIPEHPGDVSQHTTRFVSLRLAQSPANSTAPLGHAWKLKDTIHADQFRIDFLFTFGLIEHPAGDAQPEDFLERIKLLDPLVGRETHYDLICINAGLWDLEKFNREFPNQDPAAGLTSEWVDSYIERYLLAIERLRTRYGTNTPISIRLLHDLSPVDKQLRFTPLRAAQLRQAQLEVVRRTGVRVLPFAELMRMQPFHYTPDGAHPNPAGNMLHSEMMLRLLAEVQG